MMTYKSHKLPFSLHRKNMFKLRKCTIIDGQSFSEVNGLSQKSKSSFPQFTDIYRLLKQRGCCTAVNTALCHVATIKFNLS